MDTNQTDPMSYSNPAADAANAIALPIFAAISSLSIVIPFRAFYTLRNFPAASMCITIWLLNLSTFLNAIIWNTDDWTTWWEGPVLCDIESLLRWPITLSGSTSIMCLIRGLANAIDTDGVNMNPSKSQRRWKLIVEILLIWGVPVAILGLHYIFQSGRYAIIPVFGCTDEIDLSWPFVVIVIIWGPIFTLGACYYSAVLLYRLKKHRQTISSALLTTGSGMNSRKFIKLALMAAIVILVFAPVQILYTVRDIPTQLHPFNWAAVHNYPEWNVPSYYHTQDIPTMQYQGWAPICYGLIFSPFYLFNDDAIRTYRRWLVVLGFGVCYPALKMPYRPRRNGGSSSGSMGWDEPEVRPGRFDLVSKVLKHFDHGVAPGNMSVGSTTVTGNCSVGSRNDSVSTFLSSHKRLLATHTTSLPRSKHLNFSTIRNFNPVAFFSSTSSRLSVHNNTVADGDGKSFTTAQNSSRDLEANNISTNIWSPATANTDEPEVQPYLDPLSPPMGSRAFRERERREMEREKAERKALNTVNSMNSVISESISGVVISKEVERKEVVLRQL